MIFRTTLSSDNACVSTKDIIATERTRQVGVMAPPATVSEVGRVISCGNETVAERRRRTNRNACVITIIIIPISAVKCRRRVRGGGGGETRAGNTRARARMYLTVDVCAYRRWYVLPRALTRNREIYERSTPASQRGSRTRGRDETRASLDRMRFRTRRTSRSPSDDRESPRLRHAPRRRLVRA